MVDNVDFNKTVGDQRKLPVWFENEAGEPLRITGHTFQMIIDTDTPTTINGELESGDCRVYFAVPSSVYDAAGSFTYRIVETDDTTNLPETIGKGTITYS